MSTSTTPSQRITSHPGTSSPSGRNPGQYNGPGGGFSAVSTFPADTRIDSVSGPASPTTPSSSGSGSSAGSTSKTAVSAASPPRSSLEDRQRVVWKEMHERMDRRRQEWNSQVDVMRKDFFRLSPRNNNDDAVATLSGGTDQRRALNVTAEGGAGTGGGGGGGGTVVGGGTTALADKSQLPKANVNQIVYVHPTRTAMTDSRQQFQATFDLSQYELDEISVKTDGRKLIVSARHEQNNGDVRTSFSREFSRQVDIPRHVDPTSLRCTFSKEGVLCVEASSSPSPIITTSITHLSSPAHLSSHYNNNNNYNKVLSTSHQSLGSTSSSGGGSVAGSAGVMTSSSSTPAGLPPGPIVTDPDGTRRFHVEVFIGADFQPEELAVKTVDRKLYVQAHHEETGPGRRSTSRELNREFELPEGVDPDTVTAHMTEDGLLVVEAPVGRHQEVYC